MTALQRGIRDALILGALAMAGLLLAMVLLQGVVK